MKRPWIKWCALVIAALAAIVGVPIIINECYKANSGYMTIWGAEDVLSYYGTLIAAAGAAIGVYSSIKYSHRQYREDKRRDVLPYLIINVLDKKGINPFDIGWYGEDAIGEEQNKEKDALTYKEFSNKDNFFIFKKGNMSYARKLTKEQKEDRTIYMSDESIEKLGGMWKNNNFYIPIKIKNVGKGCAINTTVTIEPDGKIESVESPSVSVPVGEEIDVGLLFYIDDGLADTYSFIMRYSDIYGNIYEYRKQITTINGGKNCNVWAAKEPVHVLVREVKDNANT